MAFYRSLAFSICSLSVCSLLIACGSDDGDGAGSGAAAAAGGHGGSGASGAVGGGGQTGIGGAGGSGPQGSPWSLEFPEGMSRDFRVALSGERLWLVGKVNTKGGTWAQLRHLDTGEIDREFAISNVSAVRGLAVSDEGVYVSFGQFSWRVAKFDPTDGSQLWRKDVPTADPKYYSAATARLVLDGSAVYVCGEYERLTDNPDWRIEARSRSDGSELWMSTGSTNIGSRDQCAGMAVDDSHLYTALSFGPLKRHAKDDGAPGWTQSPSKQEVWLRLDSNVDGFFVGGRHAIERDILQRRAFDTGADSWTAKIGDAVVDLSVTDTRLVVASRDEVVQVFDAADGAAVGSPLAEGAKLVPFSMVTHAGWVYWVKQTADSATIERLLIP